MTMSWKLSCSRREFMMSMSALARLALLAASRFVVGSSSARMPGGRASGDVHTPRA